MHLSPQRAQRTSRNWLGSMQSFIPNDMEELYIVYIIVSVGGCGRIGKEMSFVFAPAVPISLCDVIGFGQLSFIVT